MLLSNILAYINNIPIVFLIATIIAAYWILWIIYARTIHPLSNIPGPFLASISRTWGMYRAMKGDIEVVQRQLHQKYGPLIRIAHDEVSCAAPDAIKKIYPAQAPLTKTDFYVVYYNPAVSKYPDNFTERSEKLHSERRKIVNNVYSLSNVLQSESYIDKCTDLFTRRMNEYAESNEVVDFGQWLHMYTFDVVGEIFFGRMFGFMDERKDYQAYIQSLDTLMPILTLMAVSPSYLRPAVLVSSIIFPTVRRAVKSVNHIADATRSCVGSRNTELQTPTSEPPRRDLLQQLFGIWKTKGEKVDFSIHEIEMESYAAMLAGSDTIAIAMRSLFYHLLKNPDIYAQVQAEIDTADANHLLSPIIQYSEAVKLPFLCVAIKEAMRLHPSVAMTLPRHVPAGGMRLCGQYLPAGYRVGINAAVVQYDKSIFGPDADKFRPSRWLEGDDRAMDKAMLHYGAGTRTCLGMHLAAAEIHKFIPQILRQFTLELAHDKPWTTHNQFFNKQFGIDVRLKRRDNKH